MTMKAFLGYRDKAYTRFGTVFHRRLIRSLFLRSYGMLSTAL
jgi:hypothetical protein